MLIKWSTAMNIVGSVDQATTWLKIDEYFENGMIMST